jgi:valyl-tRNA synthetase
MASIKTEFSPRELPNRFDFSAAQPRIYADWEKAGVFHSKPDKTRKPFTIVIPPPNVTGALHLGHALNNSLQDILIRFRRMQGFNALWMPGTDHAGIATQAVVERRLREEEGKTRHDLGRDALVKRIWQWKEQYEQRILGQLRQLGASCDWSRTRFTLDPMCATAVRRTFFDLFRSHKIYRGKRLVNWDTFLQTAVSDDELFHETVQGHFWHFRYPVIKPLAGEPTYVTIATTRPETMLADTAVAVHPDPAAALEKYESELKTRIRESSEKERAGLEDQLAELSNRKLELLPHLIQLRDMALDGRKLMLPLINRPIPLVADLWAKPEMGSGCVKITPAHDPNDYEVGKRQNLPRINILVPDGTLNANAGKYQGLTIQNARQRVVQDLQALGLVAEIEDREIDLAHSDRSKTPIEPFLADQWFVSMKELAESAMLAVQDGRVQIIPKRYAKGYLDWLAEKRDWPVSRQLWWGHQIPVWSRVCKDQAELDAAEKTAHDIHMSHASQVHYQVEHAEGDGDGPFAVVQICIDEGIPSVESQCEAMGFVRDPDVLDTWFSSALWPHSTLGWPNKNEDLAYYYPTSTLITSRDIITLWVARMVLTGLHNLGEVPFKEVFIHPKILDGYGETMSKSKGNGVDPLDVIQKFGADALRFGLAYLTTDSQDVRMPVQFECPHCQVLLDQTRENRELPKITCTKCRQPFATQWAKLEADQALPRGAVVSDRFELARNFTNKLWNASRFALINLEGYLAVVPRESDFRPEDRWILSRLATVTKQATGYLETYKYAEAARTLYDFAWDEFCSFYIEMLKERFQDPATRGTAQAILAFTLDTLLRLLHPFVPFITEEIWHLLGQVCPRRGISQLYDHPPVLALASWPSGLESYQNTTIEQQFSTFQGTISAVREIRSRQNIPPKQEIEFSVRCEPVTAALLQPMEGYFASMAKARCVLMGPNATAPPMSASINVGFADVFVDLKDLIDVEAEIDRNEKQRHKLVDMIAGKEKKLSQESFVSKAPPDIVRREQEQLTSLREQLNTVEAALSALRKP